MRSSILGLACFLLLTACAGGDGDGDEGEEGTASAPDPSCASGERWTGGDEESKLMHPGLACIACHQSQGEGPTLRIAGTVHAAEHEAADCFGVSGAEVVVTDANAQTVTLATNSAGNFMHSADVAFPIQVKVTFGGKAREMLSPVTDGDCNGCHDETGAQGAPGRVLLP